jgi:hypothetical protein
MEGVDARPQIRDVHTARMKPLIVLLQLVSFAFPTAPVDQSLVLSELYQQIVARRPLGIPKGDDKAALALPQQKSDSKARCGTNLRR